MKGPAKKEKEKQHEEALAKLRKELTEEIEQRLPERFRTTPKRKSGEEHFESAEIQNDEEAKRVVEAILFAASKPVTVQELKRALGGMSASKIEQLVRDIRTEYETQGRSFRIQE